GLNRSGSYPTRWTCEASWQKDRVSTNRGGQEAKRCRGSWGGTVLPDLLRLRESRVAGQSPLQTVPKRVRCAVVLTVHHEPIQIFNRYTGEVETEEIYGEPYMRWTY